MRYEGFLQREFSRALRDLSMLQADRRARLAEADAQATPPAPAEPESPAAVPKTEETNRTQFPGPTPAPAGFQPDPPQNPNLIPFPGVNGGSPKR